MFPDFLLLLNGFPGTRSQQLGAAQGLSEMFAGCLGCHREENAHLCRAVGCGDAEHSSVQRGMLVLTPVLQKKETEEAQSNLLGLERNTPYSWVSSNNS